MGSRLLPLLLPLLVLAHMETALPEALRPLGRPEMAELPAFMALLRGVPSPERPYFAKLGPEPATLILKALGTALVLAWLLIATLVPPGRGRRGGLLAVAGLLLLLLFALPAAVPVVARARSGDPALAHDGGTIQIEEACRMLWQGRNPYRESYLGTPLEKWRGLETPIVDHLPYFPWAVLPLVPVQASLEAAGMADLRLVYHGIAILVGLVLAWPARRSDAAATLLVLPFFTPHLARASILGTNDLYAIAWVVAAVTLARTRRLGTGLVVMGLAMAVKQFCWPLLPILLARHRARLSPRRLALLPAAAFLAVSLPFLAWDPGSFLDDTFGYALGGSATTHPIKGVGSYGFGSLALAWGLVDGPRDPFPATLLGVLAAGLVAAAATWRQWRAPDDAELPVTFALSLLPLLYFSRYFHANFLGYGLFFLLWGALGGGGDGSTRPGLGSATGDP